MAVGDPSDGAVGQILLRDAQLGGFAPQTGVGGESAQSPMSSQTAEAASAASSEASMAWAKSDSGSVGS